MNLKQIARLSGVSPSTVSRVLNNHHHVSEAARKRVLDIVQQLNYQPNAAARSLAAGQTRVLGLVILRDAIRVFSEPYFSPLVVGVSSACNAGDRSVMLWLVEPKYERQTIGRICAGGLIDGVILSTMRMDDPVVNALRDAQISFVLIGRCPPGPPLSYVDVANLEGAHEAVTHLVRLGRRRIATITGPLNMTSGMDRRDGYVGALEQQNMAVESALMCEGDYSEAGGYFAMQRLLDCRPDAIFAANDSMAMGALRAIGEAGLRVPDDIAVVGFDDVPFAAQTVPPLTTVRQPIEQAGRLAAQMLIELIESPAASPKRMILPTVLVIRDSCGFRIQPALTQGRGPLKESREEVKERSRANAKK